MALFAAVLGTSTNVASAEPQVRGTADLEVGAAVERELPEVAAFEVGDAPNAAEMQDIRTIAEQEGMTVAEATDRYGWNDNFFLAVSQVRDAFPDDFTSAAILDSDSVWIGFKADAPRAAEAELSGFFKAFPEIDAEIRTDFGFAEEEGLVALEEAYYQILESEGVRDASAWIDYESREIVAIVRSEDGSQRGMSVVEADVSRIAQNSLRESLDGSALGVSVTVGDGVLGGTDSNSRHYGGELTNPGCTSGFTVRTNSSTSGSRGVTTAGHCSNSQNEDGALTYQAGHVGANGDFQWHTGPDIVRDDFYSGNTTITENNLRDVSGIQEMGVGGSVCKNGRTNHKSCQQVRNTNVCSGSVCRLTQMGERLAAGGDSGGPIFWGNTAYGFHRGWHYSPSWPFDRDLYSKSTRIDNALGVHVATS